MSTRGAVGFILDGKTIASYNHSDSYPDYLGKRMLAFARGVLGEPGSGTFETLVKSVRKLKAVDTNGSPTKAQAASLERKGLMPSNVSTGSDWYSWLRENQGDLTRMLLTGYYTDDAEFLQDGLFCEWAYLIDLDTQELRVFESSAPVATWRLDDLPDEAEMLALEGRD